MEWRTQQTQWPALTTWQSLEGGGVKEEHKESQRHQGLSKSVKSETQCVIRIRGTANGCAKAWKAEPQVICHGAM